MPAGNNFAEQCHDESEDILVPEDGISMTSDKTPENASHSRGITVGEPCSQANALPPKTLAESFSHAPEYCRRINGFFSEGAINQKVEETALPALKLHLFNFLLHNTDATEGELEEEFAKINRLSDIEREFSEEGNPLPTIGIEIELPRTHLSKKRVETLTQLGIPNEDAIDMEQEFWEVNPGYSYSPWVQARTLEELAEFGAIPLDANEREKRVSKNIELPLHINFGIPEHIHISEDRDMNSVEWSEVILLNDCLNYAFTSPERLEGGKYGRTYHTVKEGSRSKKSVRGKSGVTQIGTAGGLHRLELRAFEFRDYPTFRLLAESQKIVAMLFAHLGDARLRNTQEAALAELWKNFSSDVRTLFAQKALAPNAIETFGEKIIKANFNELRETDLRARSRAIVTHYAQGVTNIIARTEKKTHLS